ncbi:lysophospholipid acyltransferase family protein [Algoriphagus sediminis]|uniref:Lysophospholipid acyltransferase family protein n=1 Tax=Algoriphagus sediminis TaxID=3057113 RepID=A0ABT7YA95_9BACT|nr:lysophospholipid acyltransferase family protein [Algoriphagus sediminis]MDN3203413.1 lysophospholipid acyltransferase family protein [Algoriphagus sediminis]
MRDFFARLYSIYAGVLFLISFLLIYPFFLLCIWIPGWDRAGRKATQYWARVYFTLIFLPVKKEMHAKIEKGKPYLFLPNHFSYLDIAMMGYTPTEIMYVGKASIRKAPLFGYYFKKLHIAVERTKTSSRVETMRRAGVALDNKTSVVLFPEGGIYTENPPQMVPFKNGAFRLSIKKQIPIIPVTISYNHIILPEGPKLLLYWHPAKLVYHKEILPGPEDTEETLKKKCFDVIQNQLRLDQANENR